MRTRLPVTAAALLAAPLLAACAVQSAERPPEGDNDVLLRMLDGRSAVDGAELARRIAAAEASPLGSAQNPIRTAGVEGEYAYLARLRCADGDAAMFEREGNVDAGPFGNVVDVFRVACAGGSPAETMAHLDMFHRDYRENRPLPGFTIMPASAD